jgi:hypothetical protein
MAMLVKFYQSHPENPFHPENHDSDKLELKCITSEIKLTGHVTHPKSTHRRALSSKISVIYLL